MIRHATRSYRDPPHIRGAAITRRGASLLWSAALCLRLFPLRLCARSVVRLFVLCVTTRSSYSLAAARRLRGQICTRPFLELALSNNSSGRRTAPPRAQGDRQYVEVVPCGGEEGGGSHGGPQEAGGTQEGLVRCQSWFFFLPHYPTMLHEPREARPEVILVSSSVRGSLADLAGGRGAHQSPP